jgi:G3E family GTPase
MVLHLLSGFLGSGKTTAIHQACKVLQKKGSRVGVITNDQGLKLVDGLLFRKIGIPERRVGNGCFCCNYADLDSSIGSLIEEHQPDVLFAESVGSCTDIVATVMKPLIRFRSLDKVTLTTMVDTRLLHMLVKRRDKIFHEDVEYIYFKQLEEAEIIVLNKTDLADPVILNEVLIFLHLHYAGTKIILQNSLQESSISHWLNILSTHEENMSLSSLTINYDKYASGEAKMGYLDQQFVIRSNSRKAEDAALFLIQTLVRVIRQAGATIGHLKFWINDKHKLSFTSTASGFVDDQIQTEHAATCSLVINARVQVSPGTLNEYMNQAIESAIHQHDISIEDNSLSFFKPGYPRPLHRIGN